MKRNKLIFTATALLLLGSLPVSAQIDPTVEVSREYDVKLISIDKPFAGTSVPDSLRTFKINMDYYTVEKPYGDLYDFSPHQTYLLARSNAVKAPLLYAKAEIGAPLGASASFGIETAVKKGFSFSAALFHDSYWPSADSVNGVRHTAFMKNGADLKGRYAWRSGEATLDLAYRGDMMRFWDSVYTKSVSNSFAARAGVRSVGNAYMRTVYDVSASYGYSYGSLDGSFREHDILFNANVGGVIGDSRFMLDVENRTLVNGYTAGIFSASPYYRYLGEAVDVRLGVKFGGRYGGSSDTLRHDNGVNWVFPLLDFRVRVIPDVLWVQATVDGGNDLNSFTGLRSDNPWITTLPSLRFSSAPYSAKLEARLNAGDRLALSAFGSFTRMKNMPFAVIDEVRHVQNLVYADANTFSAGADAVWVSRPLTARAWYRYGKCVRDDGGVSYLIPEHRYGASVRYNYMERVFAEVSASGRSSVAFDGGVLGRALDLGFDAGYVFDRSFTFFLRVSNILGLDNESVPWSLGRPRSASLGAAFKF